MKYILKHAVAFAVVGAMLFCVACEKQQTKSSTMENTYFSFEPVTEIVEGRKNIYAVLKVLSGQYWESIVQGITDSGKEYGYNVYVGGVAKEGDSANQAMLLEQAMNAGADAIVFAPADSSAFGRITARLQEKQIPLVLVDTILTSGSYDICYMTDNFQAGELAAEELYRTLDAKYSHTEEIEIGIQVTTINSQTVVDRVAGFNNYWTSNAPENWKILDEVKFNYGDVAVAKQNGTDFLEQYPNIKALAAFNNSSSVGFAQSVAEAGRKDIIISAFDYSDEVAGLIADPSYTVTTIVQKQYNMGYLSVESASALADGKTPECKFVDTGVVAINEDNYKDYED